MLATKNVDSPTVTKRELISMVREVTEARASHGERSRKFYTARHAIYVAFRDGCINATESSYLLNSLYYA